MSDEPSGAAPPTAATFGHLAAALAHEVRNPLNSMAIHLELIESRVRKIGAAGADGDAIARSLVVLRQDIERVDDVLRRFLEHLGPAEAQRRPVAPMELLSAAVDRAADESARRGVHVAAVDEGVDGPWTIDGPALVLALEALVANALEASRPGGEVCLAARRQGDLGVIDVKDTGEGFEPDVEAEIYQLGWTTRPGHAGLGLAVARQIVKGRGGTLTLKSAGADLGCVARIELPLEDEG